MRRIAAISKVDNEATMLEDEDEDKGKDPAKYDLGLTFSKEILQKMLDDEPLMQNYLQKLTKDIETSVVQNHMSQLLQIKKKWEAFQYYYK